MSRHITRYINFYVRVQQWRFLVCGRMLEMRTPTPDLAHGWMVNSITPYQRFFSPLCHSWLRPSAEDLSDPNRSTHHTQEKPSGTRPIKVSGNKTDCFLWYQLLIYYCLKMPTKPLSEMNINPSPPPPPHLQPNKRTFHWYLNGEESTVIHIWRRLLIGNRGKNSNHKYDCITLFSFCYIIYTIG